MAAVYMTESIASGALTGIIYFNEGAYLTKIGHYNAATAGAGTAHFDSGMFFVAEAWASHFDAINCVQTVNANGTIVLEFAGMTAAQTGWFCFRGY